jgi:hypothetical protein
VTQLKGGTAADDSPVMAAARRSRLPILAASIVAAVALGGGAARGADAPRIDGNSTDVYELVARFQGPWTRLFGSSHEWWSPRTGYYRVDNARPREPFQAVYDGASMTRRSGTKVFRVEGESAMLRYLASRQSMFDLPAIEAVRQDLRHQQFADVRVTPRDGGRSFDVDIHYRDENGVDEHIRYTVDVRASMTLDEARARGLLRPLEGRVVGILKQSAPGTHPHLGQAGYWFGRSLGKARAVTLLEERGADPARGSDRMRPPSYTTIYRFPGSRPADYPGLGNQGPSDIRVECRAREKGWLPGVSATTKGRPVRVAGGKAATLYMESYTQGTRSGVSASLVVGRTACFIHGLIAAQDLVRLTRTFRRT